MLVEILPDRPYPDAIWIGGYWVWEGDWIWAHGRWAPPPQPGYGWVNPYYENRGGSVVFVNGFWAAPGVSFIAPAASVNIAFGVVGVNVIAGQRPIGPEGIFVPPPPGSRFGLIVPAPIGTSPAVVVSAPPVINEGMRIHVNNISNNTTTINNVTNVTNITKVTNVMIVAPASATANGQAVNASVPAQAHLAAALPPVVKAFAPEPVSSKPIPAYAPGRPAVVLPLAQIVHSDASSVQMHAHAAEQMHPGAAVTTPIAVTHPPATVTALPALRPTSPENQLARDRAEMQEEKIPQAVKAQAPIAPPPVLDTRAVPNQKLPMAKGVPKPKPVDAVPKSGNLPPVKQKPANKPKTDAEMKKRHDDGKQAEKKNHEHE